jgi:hypothetical protein
MLKVSALMGKCPDSSMEGYMAWARRAADGKETYLPEAMLVTAETSGVKTTLDNKTWHSHGDPEIRRTLSLEFAAVAQGELQTLGKLSVPLEWTCRELAGLFGLDCSLPGDRVPLPQSSLKPDCDFDGSFGEPCDAEQQRAFDARKGQGVLNSTPTPVPWPG